MCSKMFRITEDPSSGKLVQCLAKNYKNDSIVFVDMDMSMSTDKIESFLQFLAKHCTKLSDDGSSVIRNMLEHI